MRIWKLILQASKKGIKKIYCINYELLIKTKYFLTTNINVLTQKKSLHKQDDHQIKFLRKCCKSNEGETLQILSTVVFWYFFIILLRHKKVLKRLWQRTITYNSQFTSDHSEGFAAPH